MEVALNISIMHPEDDDMSFCKELRDEERQVLHWW